MTENRHTIYITAIRPIFTYYDAVHSIILLQGRHDYTEDTSESRGLYSWLAEKP